jgi:hypothetical protein
MVVSVTWLAGGEKLAQDGADLAGDLDVLACHDELAVP